MKRNLVKNKVEASGNFKRQQFRVDNNADVFQLLISNIYSRTIEAFVRELSCNAYDAHVDAGNKDRPFDIKVPNALDHTFYIKDYGTGLTPDQIYNLYTVLGLSDKTNSNDLIGSFGVGSKSPFAYTQQFSVESVVDGTKWIYSAYMNEQGIPEIADLSDGGFPTDEEDGLKVSFDIERKDWNDFYAACAAAYYPFETKPNFIGAERSDIVPEKNYILEDEGEWGLRGGNVRGMRHLNGGKNLAIMGNVAYEIDIQQLIQYPLSKKQTNALMVSQWKNYTGLDLYFNIGDLTPAASREYLQYDAQTCENLIAKISKIEDKVRAEMKEKFKDCKTLLDARKKAHEIEGTGFLGYEYRGTVFYSVVSDYLKYYKFNGKTVSLLDSWVTMETLQKDFATDEKFKVYDIYSTESQKLLWNPASATSWYKRAQHVKFCLTRKDSDGLHGVKFVIADEKYCKFSKAKHFAGTKDENIIFLDTELATKAKKSLLNLGVPESDIFMVSDLDKPVSTNTAARKAALTKLENQKKYIKIAYNSRYHGNVSDIWRSDSITDDMLKAPGVYVVRKSYYWDLASKSKKDRSYGYNVDMMRNINQALWNFPRDTEFPTIYSIPPSKVDLIPDHWQPLEEFLASFYDWLQTGLGADFELSKAYPRIYRHYSNTKFAAILKVDDAAKIEDPKLQTWVNKLKKIEEANNTYSSMKVLRDNCAFILSKGDNKQDTQKSDQLVKDFRELMKYFQDKYAFLNSGGVIWSSRYLTKGEEDQQVKELIEHLNMVHDYKENCKKGDN